MTASTILTTLSDVTQLSKTILEKYPESGVMYSGFYRASNGQIKKQTKITKIYNFVTGGNQYETFDGTFFITSILLTNYYNVSPRQSILIQENTDSIPLFYWELPTASPEHMTSQYNYDTPLRVGKTMVINGTEIMSVILQGFIEEN